MGQGCAARRGAATRAEQRALALVRKCDQLTATQGLRAADSRGTQCLSSSPLHVLGDAERDERERDGMGEKNKQCLSPRADKWGQGPPGRES